MLPGHQHSKTERKIPIQRTEAKTPLYFRREDIYRALLKVSNALASLASDIAHEEG